MAARRVLRCGRRIFLALAILCFSISLALCSEPGKKDRLKCSAGMQLVRKALEAELAGNDDQRTALLRQALCESPDDPAVHWQLGEVKVQGKWMSPAELADTARDDRRLAEYRQRRDAAKNTVEDQATLARWCRKNRLDSQQRAHWISVLQRQPDNAEALQALSLRPFQGKLLTAHQIAQTTTQRRAISQAMKRWQPLVAQWRRAAEGKDREIPAAVKEKIAKISNSTDMIALEGTLWRQVGAKRQTRLYGQMTAAMMPVLGSNPQPAAAESLARYAGFSPYEEVRRAAIVGLKRKPLDHYAPLLLSGLQSPIEAAMQCRLDATGALVTSYSLFQEGALANVSCSMMISPINYPLDPMMPVSVTPGTGTVTFDSPKNKQLLMQYDPGRVAAAYAQAAADAAAATAAAAQANAANKVAAAENWQNNARRSAAQAAQNAAALRATVDRANQAIAQRNSQLIAVLSQVTGLKLGDEPMAWWAWWWQEYNEMYDVKGGSAASGSYQPRKPEYHYEERIQYAGTGPAHLPITSVGNGAVALLGHSCFAPGTKVWTLTGRESIETIKPGDCVLAQDVESGELAYKPVLATTVRRTPVQIEVGIAGETITATPSHPFWVCGQGWRMTKQLAVGNRVRTTSGDVLVDSIEQLEDDESAPNSAYNLIVDDFGSYFVGEHGILVHDNTPRRPTAALVPGLVQ